MKVSAPLKYPFLYELAQVHGNWVSKRGVYKFVIESLITHYNFTLSVFPSPGHGSGVQWKNGTWNGVMGQLLNGQADFGASTSPNPSRFPLTSYSTAMIYPFVSFTIGLPKLTYSWKAIYWPFTPELWLSIIVSLIVVICTFKLLQIIWKRDNDGDFPFYRHLVVHLSFTLIGNGLPYPKGDVARIILGVWLLTTLIFNTLYVSKIVELLAFPIYEKQPTTFKELVESSDFSWGFDKAGGNMFQHFKTSSNPVFQKIIEKKQSEKEAIDCYKSAINSKFACITWAGAANYIAYKNLSMIHGKSPLIFSDDITLSIPTGITFPLRTLHRLNFDKNIGRLRDSGQIDKWIEQDLVDVRRDKLHWEHKEKIVSDDKVEDSGPVLLSLSNLLGIFGLYFVGQSCALVLLIVEVLTVFRSKVLIIFGKVRAFS
ncbi:unnamed protein product [Orchesella dallaii]|uniref:Ionotropic glutamate receptor C-terminal domain-containing protein n=1 Tax=Orchesella dallaii TaxID=48710 RepID=A0ABP1QHS9_9HEXA